MLGLFAYVTYEILNPDTYDADRADTENIDTAIKGDNYSDLEIDDLHAQTLASLESGEAEYQNNVSYDEFLALKDTEDRLYAIFWSPLCAHCHTALPFAERAMSDVDGTYVKINTLEYPDAMTHEDVYGTPSMLFYYKGNPVAMAPGEPGDIGDDFYPLFIAEMEDWISEQ